MRKGRREPEPAKPIERRSMKLEVGVLPYADGSGHSFVLDVRHESDSEKDIVRHFFIKQGSDTSLVVAADEWATLRDAIDRAVAIVYGVAADGVR